MKMEELGAIVAIAFVLIFVFYFITVKGANKKITVTNSNGSNITLEVEIANNITTRAKGLMGRNSLGEYEGMFFVFDKPAIYSFWMFNTSIALDALYVSQNGTVVDIIEMEPCGINPLCPHYSSREKAQYVLEVNRGFSKKHNITVGSTVSFAKIR